MERCFVYDKNTPFGEDDAPRAFQLDKGILANCNARRGVRPLVREDILHEAGTCTPISQISNEHFCHRKR